MMSEVFWTGLYSSLIGFVLAMGSQCYKSKCEKVSLCCMTIQRNIQAEEDIDINNAPKIQLQHNHLTALMKGYNP